MRRFFVVLLVSCSTPPGTSLLGEGVGVMDAGADAGSDASIDGGFDADFDAGGPDASIRDAGQPRDAGGISLDGGRLTLNDVSWLFPRSTELLPLEDFLTAQQIQATTFATPDQVRIVSVRIDPCFPVAAGVCGREVRLVGQRIDPVTLEAADSAIHLFYVFTDADWAVVQDDVLSLAILAGGRTSGALDVHPIIARDGWSGTYGVALRSFLTRHCTASRLNEIALLNAGAEWRFFRFSVTGGVLTRIATTGSGWFSVFPIDAIRVAPQRYAVPSPDGGAEGELFADGGVARTILERLAQQRNVLGELQEAIARVENPIDEPTPLLDCGICHRATQLRVDHVTKRGLTALPPRFSVPVATQPPPAIEENNFHAFSWHGTTATITHRTVFESSVTAISMTR